MDATLAFYALGAALSAATAPRLKRRLDLSRAKHPSLAGHARLAAFLARLAPGYDKDAHAFFRADDAGEEVAARRERGFALLAQELRGRAPLTLALTAEAREGISDLQFTAAYRVPFPFSAHVRAHLPSGAFMASAQGVTLTDLDGNVAYDLGGSYGVNLLGTDAYRGCLDRGAARVRALGPVLGPYHPVVADNVARLRALSGLDEVSFHMSGTEAVMQAVRLARYHTRRSHLVRFCGAYHGWWGDVQPGVGNPTPPPHTYTLKDMHEDSLRVLRQRDNVACVLVNPLQALHPDAGAPSDSTLLSERRAGFDRAAYTDWLRRLRAVCSARGIVLIFDEVFVGFRLAPGGAQEYFGVKADLVTYGKTLGGGLPVGAVCGRRDLMKRYREDRPSDVCFARGTFNSHPYVMGAMNEFLRLLDTPSVRRLYEGLDDVWEGRAQRFNAALAAEDLPVRVAALSSIWTVCYPRPGRYHWMLQYYLRAQGLFLGWTGTGRLIFSLDYTDADCAAVVDRFLAAARRMREDGWWDGRMDGRAIRRRLLRELWDHRRR